MTDVRPDHGGAAMTLDALERLAWAATPGPWENAGPAVWPEGRHRQIGYCWLLPDAAYIAAADPDTVKALIARIRELERQPIDRERLRQAIRIAAEGAEG